MEEMIRLCGKVPDNTKILLITTAAKPLENPEFTHKELERLKEKGFQIREYDIEDKGTEEIEIAVNESDIIFVMGGEPFYLLKAIRASGFDEVIKKQSQQKVYVGASAGSYAACPSAEMGLWKNPERNTYGISDYKGMGLVDFLVFAHFVSNYNSLINQKKQELAPLKIQTLTDSQALVVLDGQINKIVS